MNGCKTNALLSEVREAIMTATLQEALTETVMITEVSGSWKGLKNLACQNSVKLQFQHLLSSSSNSLLLHS